MMVFWIVITFLVAGATTGFTADLCSEVQKSQCTPPPHESYVQTNCSGSFQAPCCYDPVNSIVGLDLRGCKLTDISPDFFQNTTNLILSHILNIDLSDNPFSQSAFNNTALKGMTSLIYLALPKTFSCPVTNDLSAKELWEVVHDDWQNFTECIKPKNVCLALNFNESCPQLNNQTLHCRNCPENSHCIPDGPGFGLCACKQGFHGYKCMRQGTFPLWQFLVISGVVTFVLTAVLWLTQRRHVNVKTE